MSRMRVAIVRLALSYGINPYDLARMSLLELAMRVAEAKPQRRAN